MTALPSLTQAMVRYLADYGRRRLVFLIVRDGVLGLVSLAVGLLGLLLVMPALPPGRLWLTSTILVSATIVIGFLIRLTRLARRLRRPLEQARIVGGLRPTLACDLLSVIELSDGRDQTYAPFSTVLYAALCRSTYRRLVACPARGLVPAERLAPATVGLGLVSLVWLAAALAAPDRLEAGARLLFSPVPVNAIQLAPQPLVADLALVYRFPAYMARPDRLVESSTGQIAAPKGTRISLGAALLRPCIAASLEILPDEAGAGLWRRPLRLEPGRVKGELVVAQPGTYRFRLESTDGQALMDPVKRRIDVETDAPPRATVFGPKDGKEVTRRHVVEVGYIVEDDVGIDEVALVYQAGASTPGRRVLWSRGKQPAPRRTMGKADFNLAEVPMGQGGQVSFWIEAKDNDTVTGPKVGRSAVHLLRVYSADERHRQALDLHQRILDGSVQVLGSRLLLFEENVGSSTAPDLDRVAREHLALSALTDSLRELRNAYRQDPLASRALLRQVSRAHQRLSRLFSSETTLLKHTQARPHSAPPGSLKAFREHNRSIVPELEQTVLLLADLLDEQRLQHLASMAERLRQGRTQLARLLEQYRKAPDENLRRKILQQIEQLKQEYDQLMAQASKLESEISDEYLNASALGTLDVKDRLDSLAGQVRSGKLDGLDQALADLDKQLARLDGLLGGGLKSLRDGRMPEQEKRLEEAMDRLAGLEREQRDIAGRTRELISRYRRRASQMMQKTLEPFLRRQQARAAELKKRVAEVESLSLPAFDQEQLERIRDRVEDLDRLLRQGDLDEAIDMARRAHSGLRLLEDDLSAEEEGLYAARRQTVRRAHQRTRAARRLAGEMAAELEAVFPSPGSMLEAADRRRLEELGRRQRGLVRKTRQTASELEKQAQVSPFMSPSEVRRLDEAADQMEDARSKLFGQKLQEAHGHQEAAAEALSRMQKQIMGSRMPRQSGSDGDGGPREPVQIPGAEGFTPPAEFRKDILEAMKEKAPALYEELVKRYYEELVR